MENILLGIGSIIIIGIVTVIILLINKRPSTEGTQQIAQQFLDRMNQDRMDRHQENESLRQEFRMTNDRLEKQFFRINQTVDHKLTASSKSLNERLDKSTTVIGNLQTELGKMSEIGSKIEHLDNLLRAPKGRGAMGEESLEEILRSVFPSNLWQRQYSLKGVGIVDAVLKTSSGILPIDAKFPLSAFEDMLTAQTEDARLTAGKTFYRDVKNRINEVEKYIVPEAGTMNFAILFLPNENIYYEATIRRSDINQYARSKNVLITGPNTLLYVLQVLFQAYQSQNFAEQAQAALAQIQGIKKQAVKVDTAIQTLGKHIHNAQVKVTEVERENQKLIHKIQAVSTLPSTAQSHISSPDEA
jgi:DNA recombination protein RmuC